MSTYRPPNWPYDLSVSFEQVVALGRAATTKGLRKEPLKVEDLNALLACKLLRDCYITDEWVWRLASCIAGKPYKSWHCDPFYNEWSHTKDFVCAAGLLLDGHDGKDGLQIEPDQSPSLWLGDCLINGPHSCTERWIVQTAIHGVDNIVACVVQTSGQKWLMKYGMQCDVAVELGRMNYIAPPGMPPAQANPLGSSLLLWIPSLRGKTYEPTMYRVKDSLGKVHTVLARAGRGGNKTSVIEVP